MLEFSLHIWSETFYILRRIQRDIVISVRTSSCKIPVLLVRFKWNSNLLDKYSKNIEIYFKKSRPVAAELFHADGWTGVRTHRQTDMKLISAFRKLAKGPETHLFWPKSFSLSFVCISETAASLSLYSFKGTISITETEGLLGCANGIFTYNSGEIHL
jgi:hypothetical protein